MSKTATKHTPGPWEAHQGWADSTFEDGDFRRRHPNWCEVTGPEHLSINGHFGIANARLIAAAPDMLEIHEDSIDVLEVVLEEREEVLGEECEVLRDLIRRKREVIAKAKGHAALSKAEPTP